MTRECGVEAADVAHADRHLQGTEATALAAGLRAYVDGGTVHESAIDMVTDVLRRAILDGVLPPAAWLREAEIAQALRVSRTPVREALRRLTDENLTLRSARRGTYVVPMSLDDILAVYLVRERLEALAARLVAARRPNGIVGSLTDLQYRMVGATADGDTAAVMSMNLEFHRQLRISSGNAYLDRALRQVEIASRRYSPSTFGAPGRAAAALSEHGAIIEAIAAGDPDRAAQMAVEHMRHARQVRIQAVLERQGS